MRQHSSFNANELFKETRTILMFPGGGCYNLISEALQFSKYLFTMSATVCVCVCWIDIEYVRLTIQVNVYMSVLAGLGVSERFWYVITRQCTVGFSTVFSSTSFDGCLLLTFVVVVGNSSFNPVADSLQIRKSIFAC